MQVRGRTVSLVGTGVNPFNRDGVEDAVNRPVVGRVLAVESAPGVVETPILRDALGGVTSGGPRRP